MDEARRLETLLAYRILDTASETGFDELTSMAAEICEMPISMISLVDRDRQWFKSKVGIENPETPRDISFCSHALTQPDLFIVPNASDDPRFRENPLVLGEPHIRFYAGAPLRTRDGIPLGTLCVIDRDQRELTDWQKKSLHILSRQVMARLDLHRRSIDLVEAEALLLKTFRNAPVAVVLRGWKSRIVRHVNDAFVQLVGWPREEAVGRTLDDLHILETDGAPHDSRIVTVRTMRGKVRRALMDSTIVLEASEPEVITTLVDITDLLQHETIERTTGRLPTI